MLKKLNFIIPLVNYLQNTPIWKILVEFTLGVAFILVVGSVYILATNFDFFAEIYQNKFTESNIRSSLEQSVRINVALETIILDNDKDISRAYVYKYHNGTDSLNGVPFMFKSQTHEVTTNGISSEINNLQGVPIAVNIPQAQAFLAGNCYTLTVPDNVDGLFNQGYVQSLVNRGTLSVLSCPLQDNRGTLVGYLGIDSLFKKFSEEEIISLTSQLTEASIRIRKYVSLTK